MSLEHFPQGHSSDDNGSPEEKRIGTEKSQSLSESLSDLNIAFQSKSVRPYLLERDQVGDMIRSTAPYGVTILKIKFGAENALTGADSPLIGHLVSVTIAVDNKAALPALKDWISTTEERTGYGIIIHPAKTMSDIGETLKPYASSAGTIVNSSYIPAPSVLICGTKAPTFESMRPYFQSEWQALDFTDVPLYSFDSAGTKYPEDLFHFELLPGGSLRMYAFYPDVIRHVPAHLASPQHAYMIRNLSSVYIRGTVIRPFTTELMKQMCFLENQDRYAWAVICEIDKGKPRAHAKILPMKVRNSKKHTFEKANSIFREQPGTPVGNQLYLMALAAQRLSGEPPEMDVNANIEKCNLHAKLQIGQYLADKQLAMVSRVFRDPKRYHRRFFIERLAEVGISASEKDLHDARGISSLDRKLRQVGHSDIANEMSDTYLGIPQYSTLDDGHERINARHLVRIKCNPFGWSTQAQLASCVHGARPLDRLQLRRLIQNVSKHERDASWNSTRIKVYEDIHKAFGREADQFAIASIVRSLSDTVMLVHLRGYHLDAQLNLSLAEKRLLEQQGEKFFSVQLSHYSTDVNRIVVTLNHAQLTSETWSVRESTSK